MMVAMTCTSLRKPSGKLGRSGRSVRRQVRMAGSPGRPSRRKTPPGILPAAYMRSSTSTVSGKKSMPSRGFDVTTVLSMVVSPTLHEHRAVGLGSELARLQGHFESGRIDGAGYTDCVRHGNASSLALRWAIGEAGRFPVVAVRMRLFGERWPGRWRLTTVVALAGLCVLLVVGPNYRRRPSLAISARYRSTSLRRR